MMPSPAMSMMFSTSVMQVDRKSRNTGVKDEYDAPGSRNKVTSVFGTWYSMVPS